MRSSLRKVTFGALLSAAVALVGPAVKADVIPVFDGTTAVAGGTEFSYTASLSTGSKLFTGDYFTVYDFFGYVPGSAFAPADWDISIQNTGITPVGQTLTDDPAVANITFKYIGAATIVGPVDPLGGVNAFGAVSTSAATSAGGKYASQTHKNNPGQPDDDTLQGNQGALVVPQAIPEGSSLMMWAFGLVPLGMMARRRKSNN